MTAQDQIKAFSERIGPQLDELGVEAFVLCGYMKSPDGKVSRFTLGGSLANPAYEDGLRNMNILAANWGQGKV